MEIYEALTADHDSIKPLLEKLVSASQRDQDTEEVLNQVRDLLVPHSRAEEAVFYNSLRDIAATKDLVSHSYREHMAAEALLMTLRALEKINIDWTTAAKKLQESVLHHISEEEGRIFPAARKVLLDEEAKQMRIAFERLKIQTRDQGELKNVMSMIANMMPQRFAESVRNFNISS